MTKADFLIDRIDKALKALDATAPEEARLHLLYAIGRIANAEEQSNIDLTGIKSTLSALEKDRMGRSS